MYSSDESFQRSREGYFWCLFLELRKNTRVSAETVRHESTYIILSLTRHNESINLWLLKRRALHIVPVSHSLGFRSVDDITIDCWWRQNDQTIVTRTRDKWYLTRQISILFTAIFTAVANLPGILISENLVFSQSVVSFSAIQFFNQTLTSVKLSPLIIS